MTLSHSQDIITKKTGEDLKSKVLEITTIEIKYKKFDNQNGPIYTILKSDVLMIQYENGTKDIFNESQQTQTQVQTQPTENLFLKGQMDASVNYIGYKGAGTGTLFVSLISPLVGLVPAIACSTTPPQNENLGYPNETLFNKLDYNIGYSQKAKSIKSGKVWTNWGVGFGINLVLIMILLQPH